jgi:hypothetical protein
VNFGWTGPKRRKPCCRAFAGLRKGNPAIFELFPRRHSADWLAYYDWLPMDGPNKAVPANVLILKLRGGQDIVHLGDVENRSITLRT